jgi:hypothetical protein
VGKDILLLGKLHFVVFKELMRATYDSSRRHSDRGRAGYGLRAAVDDAALLASKHPRDGVAHLDAARIYALVAEKQPDQKVANDLRDRALASLQRAVEVYPDLPRDLMLHADFKSLQRDPRFPKSNSKSDGP